MTRKRCWGMWIRSDGTGGITEVGMCRTNDGNSHRIHRPSEPSAERIDDLVAKALQDPGTLVEILISRHGVDISLWFSKEVTSDT